MMPSPPHHHSYLCIGLGGGKLYIAMSEWGGRGQDGPDADIADYGMGWEEEVGWHGRSTITICDELREI
jgi:hypothetical protein